MNSEQKTRTLIGVLAAAVVILLAYAAFGGRKPAVKPSAGAPRPQADAATSEPIPGAPTLRIEAESPVTFKSTGHQARVSSDSSLSYKWSIIGGSFEGSDEGSSVNWTAGVGAETILVCRGTSPDGRANTATLRVPLRPPVEIARFEAVPPIITEGNSARLSWAVSHATKLTLEPGAQDLSATPSSSLELKPGKTGSYTLTALDAAGTATSQSVEIKVVPAPELLSLRADPVSGSPKAFTVFAEFKGGRAELKRGGQVLASAEASPLRLPLADVEPGSSLQLSVTNEAGAYVTNTLSFSAGK